MPPTALEKSLLEQPLVPDSIAHNNRVLTSIRALSSILLGVSAGILGLENHYGFAYYIVFQALISILITYILAKGDPDAYFAGSGGRKGTGWRDVWFGGGVFSEGMMSFVLGWAGVGGMIR